MQVVKAASGARMMGLDKESRKVVTPPGSTLTTELALSMDG